MLNLLKNKNRISLFIKQDLGARICETSLFQKLKKNKLEKKSRRWSYDPQLSFTKKTLLKLQHFVFQKLPIFTPPKRKTPEAKFKTALALLFEKEGVEEFFLSTEERLDSFLQAIQKAADQIGYTQFQLPKSENNRAIIQELTTLSGKSLTSNLLELDLQSVSISMDELNGLLFTILSGALKPPSTSVLEVTEEKKSVCDAKITTRYAKYQVHHIDPATGHIDYSFEQDHVTPALETLETIQPVATGVTNQHMVLDTTEPNSPIIIGSYSDEILTKKNVLEELLFLIQEPKPGNYYLLDGNCHVPVEKKSVLFTSLLPWYSFEKIRQHHMAIEELSGKILKIDNPNGPDRYLRLNLFHRNVSLNSASHFSILAEIKGHLDDFNEISQIYFTWWTVKTPQLEEIVQKLEKGRSEEDFFLREKMRLEAIDGFRAIKKELLKILSTHEDQDSMILKALLSKKRPDGKKLKGTDELIYTDLLMKHYDVLHHKNGPDMDSVALTVAAIDKAQNGFTKIMGESYLPGKSTAEEAELFRELLNLYLD